MFACSRVHIAGRVLYTDCAEKGFCCASSTPCGYRVWSTLNKSSAGWVHTQHHYTRSRNVYRSGSWSCRFTRHTTTRNTIHWHLRCRRHTHWARAPLPRLEKNKKEHIVKGIRGDGEMWREWMIDNGGVLVVRIRIRSTTNHVGVGRPDISYLIMKSSSLDSNVETVLNHR